MLEFVKIWSVCHDSTCDSVSGGIRQGKLPSLELMHECLRHNHVQRMIVLSQILLPAPEYMPDWRRSIR